METLLKQIREALASICKSCGLYEAHEQKTTKADLDGSFEIEAGEMTFQVHSTCHDFVEMKPIITVRYNNGPDIPRTNLLLDTAKCKLKVALNDAIEVGGKLQVIDDVGEIDIELMSAKEIEGATAKIMVNLLVTAYVLKGE